MDTTHPCFQGSSKSFKSTQSNLKTRLAALKLTSLLCLLVAVTACAPSNKNQVEELPPVVEAPPPAPLFSSEPIKKPTKQQVVFAQMALGKIGYKIGGIDGIWGPRSSAALKDFEARHELVSALGFLSELNLNQLGLESGIDINTVTTTKKKAPQKDIRSKLNGKPLRAGPQLIIVEQDYLVYSEPNPYSKKVLSLKAGTGIYIISHTAGWYKIESINRKKGYIQED